jgi:hypothetical protein
MNFYNYTKGLIYFERLILCNKNFLILENMLLILAEGIKVLGVFINQTIFFILHIKASTAK